MARQIKRRCPICGHPTPPRSINTSGAPAEVCPFCQLLEQQLRNGGPDKFDKNTSFSTDPKDVYEALRSFGGPFGGGLAGGG